LADFGRGIKAGVVTGIVYTVISVILAVVGGEFLYLSGFMHAAGLAPVESPFVLFSPGGGGNVVRGIIFGVVFAALYNFLPGTTSIVKGVVLSLFLGIVTVIEVIYTTLGWLWHEVIYTTPGWPTFGWPWQTNGIWGTGTYYGGTVNLSSISLILVGIMSALVFGTLTGFLWDRFRAKKLTEARKGRAVLLVSFILGGVIWVVVGVLRIIGVAITRIPLIEPEFWWESILLALVAFIGLAGWILALAAWRKTKGGESGFKWGVAGGVMMALTGWMLLPGALAIIGGVLSGRKPATESSAAAIAQ
jgi:hypothetical protein